MAILTLSPAESDAALGDRRTAPRLPPEAVPTVTGVRVQSELVQVVNISASGVLVRSSARLTPNMRCQTEIVEMERPWRVSGRVLRCAVVAIVGSRIQYECAIAFDHRVDLACLSPSATGEDVADLSRVMVCYDANDVDLSSRLLANGW
jgi:hypothetical protein